MQIGLRHRKEVCDSISQGRSEFLQSQFMDRVFSKSAAWLKHFNPVLAFPQRQTADDSRKRGRRFPWQPCPSSRHMSILCSRIRDASYCSAAWEWCQLFYRAFSVGWRLRSSWQFLQRCQRITSFTKTTSLLLQLCQLNPGELQRKGGGGGGVGGMMSSFQRCLKSQS